MTKTLQSDKVALIIFDGWGLRDAEHDNAAVHAATPFMDSLATRYPFGRVDANGESVGLPPGQLSGSEVGHINIGAGRPIYQDVLAINKAIEDGSFFTHEVLVAAARHAAQHSSVLHIGGLVSDTGIHSMLSHMEAMADLAHREGVKKIVVHAFLDGRDAPPRSAESFLEHLEKALPEGAVIGSLCGRAIIMDRDSRWEKTLDAYDMLTEGKGQTFNSWRECLQSNYAEGIFDEFIPPAILPDFLPVQAGDSVVFTNFRSDRMRQITKMFVMPEQLEKLPRPVERLNVFVTTMTSYEDDLPHVHAAFSKGKLAHTLGAIVSEAGLTQLRAAETEKYPHVTFFFNGGIEEPFAGEQRILVPSPHVSSYAEKPEMSAPELTEQVMNAVIEKKPNLLVMNYANADMVGHTGDFEAAKRAVTCVDDQLSKIVPFLQSQGYIILITADHGNVEMMFDAPNDMPYTAHTFNDVPGYVIGRTVEEVSGYKIRDGAALTDMAPTLLTLLGLPIPPIMTGRFILVDKE